MYKKIDHVDKLQATFEAYEVSLNQHTSPFPKPADVKEKEAHFESILDSVLNDLSKLSDLSKLTRRNNPDNNEIEIFKVSSYVLNLSTMTFPPSNKIRTKLLAVISSCYEFNGKV